MRPLLVIDGDSLAHRAYHAMPKTVRLGCVVGFTNMLVRLWQAEEPRAVLVGWDSLFQPTYRTEAFVDAATKLGVAPTTINFHLQNIYQKLQVHSKTEAVAKALRNRLI